MYNQYRIKEVTILLKSGSVIRFYPQLKQIIKKTTGHLWWKKTTYVDTWEGFYKVAGEKPTYTASIDRGFNFLVFETIDEAKELIKAFEAELKREVDKLINQMGIRMEGTELVKIHPVENL